ncbi:regulator of microtubule dynamics protein 3 [Bombina bombina]|uniref:regulator of microtubule dynamics protein 3 n=1 Tax=Bombina bombina TaxID=8345 RepID=UPI00235A7245|nr:regulator of microtubule dynamics protein 3 [Bombina bombina]XP_053553860.1 regulator of microtubule dynamics protein 3 [Bombina bombina]XP_053553862.1 regulator of microtubule dynamics protein 3 [Bombina bombina]
MSKHILLYQAGLGLVGAAAGVAIFVIYRRNCKEKKKWDAKSNGYYRHKPVEPSNALETSKQLKGVSEDVSSVTVSRGEQLELLNRLDYVLNSIAELRQEIDSLKNHLHGLAEDIVGEVRSHLEESQKANRRKRFQFHRERTDSTGSSSIYFTTSSGAAHTDAESEGGYTTANAESDYDRESSRGGSEEEEEDEVSCVTVRTMRRDSVEPVTDDEETMLAADHVDEDLALLLHKSDQLHRGDTEQKREAFHLLSNNKLLYGDHQDFLWRLARSYSDMCDIAQDNEEKKSYALDGREEAEAALEKGDETAECHKWFAILCGQLSEHEGIQKRIQTGKVFKEHIQKAISLKPDDSRCYYLLGRWSYEVSNLGWLERKTASALYEEPPTATLHEALQNFLKAEELTPGFSKAARVYIAKCYKDLGNTSTAKHWLRLAADVPEVTQEDKEATSYIKDELLSVNEN